MAKDKGKFRMINVGSKRVDVDPQGSTHHGIRGIYERLLRKFKIITQIVTILPMYIIGSVCLGISLMPGIYTYQELTTLASESHPIVQIFVTGFGIALAYFIYGLTVIFVVPFFNFILRAQPKPHRGPYFSIEFFSWYVHNGLTYLVRYTILELITPTPFNILFLKLMGMKIGHNTQINTSNISDPGLIEMGDRVTVGGSVTLCAHYGQGGFLVLAPTKIGNNVTLGLKSTVMGGVTIGDDAKVLPNSVVLPKTQIPAGEIWGGVPAVKIS